MTDERYPPDDDRRYARPSDDWPPESGGTDAAQYPDDRTAPMDTGTRSVDDASFSDYSDEPYQPSDTGYLPAGSYPPRPPRRPPGRNDRSPWPMLIGVALLAILAGVMFFLVLGGDGGADPSPTPSASASAGASESAAASASIAPSAAASTEASAGPTPTPVSLEIDSIVATTVGELSVRAAPGTDATRLGSLALGTPAFVVAGPQTASGYTWYQLSALGLPPNTGCAGPIETDPFNCPVWLGWVAAASTDGVPWLTDDAGDADECAAEPIEFEAIVIGVTDLMRLHCFGSDPFTYRAYWPEMGDAGVGGVCLSQDAPSGWLICQNINQNFISIDEGGNESIGLLVSVDPASGVVMPERGTWVELTVHLDDPAAQSCDEDVDESDAGDRSAEEMVLFCRGQMVVESVTAVDGP